MEIFHKFQGYIDFSSRYLLQGTHQFNSIGYLLPPATKPFENNMPKSPVWVPMHTWSMQSCARGTEGCSGVGASHSDQGAQ